MIAKLRGVVDSIGEDWAVIDVGGVGYLVFCSGRTLSRLSAGEAVVLEIETHVREDHIHLYGFFDMAERDWFRILTTVQGVGAKVALALLSVLGADELLQAIASGDKSAITKAPGVGPKLATRILNELKDKVGTIALGPAVIGSATVTAPAAEGIGGGSSTLSDATSALVNLGYNPSEALGAVSRVAGELGDDADVEALIRGGLRELAPADLR